MGVVEVVNAASSYKLTTVAAVQETLGLSAGTDDAILGRLIDAASEEIAQVLGRQLVEERVRESLAGTGRPRILLERTPITQIHQVDLDGDVLDSGAYALEDPEAGSVFKPTGWTALRALEPGLAAGSPQPTQLGERAWRIEYTGGYWVPALGSSPSASQVRIPHLVEDVAIRLAVAGYRERERDPAIRSEALGDYRVSYSESARAVRSRELERLQGLYRPAG